MRTHDHMVCPFCGDRLEPMMALGEGPRGRCINPECEWKGTSYPESTLIRRRAMVEED